MGLSGPGHGRPFRGKKSSSRIPTVRNHEAEIRSITPADENKPLHERVQSAAPAKLEKAGGEPQGKTTRSIVRHCSSACDQICQRALTSSWSP